MDVLQERRLRLSRKKTRIGAIDKGFHFLGINYLEPQSPDGTNVSQNSFDSANQKQSEQYLTSMGGENSSASAGHSDSLHKTIVLHARTLRNAREQVKQMVNDGVSLRRIRSYLNRWCTWWVKSSQSWQYEEIMRWFIQVCRDSAAKSIAATLLERAAIKHSYPARMPAGLNVHATA